MEVFLKVFLITVLYNKVFGAQDLLAVEESDSKIPAFIRDLILDYNKKDPNIHDVAILNLENESSEMILNHEYMLVSCYHSLQLPLNLEHQTLYYRAQLSRKLSEKLP